MTLPASGTITMNQVNVELDLSGTAQIGLNDAAVRTLFEVPSGAISLSDGYGKSYWKYNGAPGWTGAPYYYWVRLFTGNPAVYSEFTVVWDAVYQQYFAPNDPTSLVYGGYTYYRGALVHDTGLVYDDFLGWRQALYYKIRRV